MLIAKPAFPASHFTSHNFADGQRTEIVWQQVDQRAELNPLLRRQRQQRIEIMLIRNPFHLGVDGLDRRAGVAMYTVQNVAVEAVGGHLAPHHFIPGGQCDRDLHRANAVFTELR